MAYIYKIINDINQKIYVGKTEFSIEKRFKEHCRDAFKERNEKRPLYSAMRKYGIEYFHIELIEETDDPEEREIYWIEQYNSYGSTGYNATLGGDGKKYIDRNEVVQVYQEVQNISETAKITNHDVHQIKEILTDAGIQTLTNKEVTRSLFGKKVIQLDKQNNFIAEFSSLREAGASIGKHHRHIWECCNHERKTAYGYKWCFSEDYPLVV